MKNKVSENLSQYFLFSIAALFISTTVLGAIRWYTPVPIEDMWDSYILFFWRVQHGVWSDWFSQANEHRIVIARILFWLDLKFFGGRSLFLVTANLSLMLAVWLCMTYAAKRLLPSRLWPIVAACIAPPCFSWMQQQNIWWANQNEFWEAYLIPLCAFLCLANSRREKFGSFGFAILFAFLSLGTMANAIVVSPLLLLMSCLIKERTRRRTATIFVTGAVGIALYLFHFVALPHPTATPWQLVSFTLAFLGSWIIHIQTTTDLGYVFGGGYLIVTAYLAIDWVRNRETRHPTSLALIIFACYVFASAAAAASGRAYAGIEAALVSRYATPVLLGWTALAISTLYRFRTRPYIFQLTTFAGVAVAVSLYPIQVQSLNEEGPNTAQQRLVGALAIVLNVHDTSAFSSIYPVETLGNKPRFKKTTSLAREMHISIFADPKMEFAASELGKPVPWNSVHKCEGAVDFVTKVKDDAAASRVDGWAYDTKRKSPPGLVLLARGGTVIGAAIPGKLRGDLVPPFGASAERSGFDGYIPSGSPNNDLTVLCRD